MTKIYTIGHSTHPLDDFVCLLKHYEITHVVDVRTLPRSRHVPWYNKDVFYKSLMQESIRYSHFPLLGGLRKANKQSINGAWHNSSFRGFADYMQTKAFFQGLKALNQLIKEEHRVVIMCAEALPWRCHRSLIADAETIRRYVVWHIMSKTTFHEHSLTAFAKVDHHTRPITLYYPDLLENSKN